MRKPRGLSRPCSQEFGDPGGPRTTSHAKRGGDALHVTFDEGLIPAKTQAVSVVALDQALSSLLGIDPRKARAVELRYFGGEG